MIRFVRGLVIAIGFVVLAVQAEAQSQRMAVPSGTIEVGGGGGKRIDAYCLDRHRPAPYGSMASVLGAGAASATVTRSSDGAALPLDAAIERGWVAFTGLGSAEGLTVASLDGQAYSIEIPRPIALSEQRGELTSDIAPTLDWMAGLGESELIGFRQVWDHRTESAEAALGTDADYAQAFGGLESLWEVRLKVDQAGAGAIAVTHLATGADAFDRLVMAANRPIDVFSGPDADRQIIGAYRREGVPLEIWLANPHALEHMSPLDDYLEAEIGRQFERYLSAPFDSKEEAEAEKMHEMLEETAAGVRLTAAKAGLLWTDPDFLAGRQTLVVSEVPGPELGAAAGGGGKFTGHDGILMAFNGGEPPWQAGLPQSVSATAPREGETVRVGQIEQGSSVWTTLAVGRPRRVDSVFLSAFDALTRAVFGGKPQQAVIQDVSEALEFNRKAYADFAPLGVVDLRLLLDDDEVLRARVAMLDTPRGVRFAALTDPIAQRP